MNSFHKIYFGAGCFWCSEAVLKNVIGIESLSVGYMGGDSNVIPSYKNVCAGKNGYIEVVEVCYNLNLISLEVLVDIFMHIHDPTSEDKQGNDVGIQYRSVVFCDNDKQIDSIKKILADFNKQKIWPDPIVTKVLVASKYYRAEEGHQEYYSKNPQNPYCSILIPPKVKKIKEKYRDYFKS